MYRLFCWSEVPTHRGACVPVEGSLCTNEFLNRVDGGITGRFRNVRRWGPFWWMTGEEFFGLYVNGIVQDTTLKCYQEGRWAVEDEELELIYGPFDDYDEAEDQAEHSNGRIFKIPEEPCQ